MLFPICFFYFSFSVQAETAYVSDQLSITVRTGKGTHRKIIALIKSNQKVEVLEKGEEWARIRLQNGKEGWALSRYLTNSIPKSVQLESLQLKYNNVAQQVESLRLSIDKLKSENKKLSFSLAEKEKACTNLQIEHDALKTESADFLNLKKEFEETSQQLIGQTKKADELEILVDKFQYYQYIRWFLAGSGVLLVGFLIGFSTKKRRRQPSLF